jgi:SAM-dependent methyltransferase
VTPTLAPSAWEQTAPPAEFLAKAIPTIKTEEVANCPVCSGSRYEQFAVGFDYEILTCSNPWRFVECVACSHVWLNPRPAVSTLSIIYPPTYYAYNYKSMVHPIAIRAKEFLDRKKLAGIAGHCAKPPQTYLDAGCGDGRFLRVMEKHGLPKSGLYGLELNPTVIERLRGEGYQAFCERVESCESVPAGTIDLATMFHVIEHVDDPGAVLRGLFRALAPGGILALETPNLDSLDAHLFHETYWGGYHIPRHWNLFRSETLSRLLRESGFDVTGTEYKTGHSFWLYSFHHWLRYQGTPWPRLAKMFDPMGGSLSFLAAFTVFDIVRQRLGFPTSAMLTIARKPA